MDNGAINYCGCGKVCMQVVDTNWWHLQSFSSRINFSKITNPWVIFGFIQNKAFDAINYCGYGLTAINLKLCMQVEDSFSYTVL